MSFLMMNRRHGAGLLSAMLSAVSALSIASFATAQDSDWIAGSGNFCEWSNWHPTIVPDHTRHAYFGRAGSSSPSVWMDCSRIIKALTAVGGTTFHTNGHQLLVLEAARLGEAFGQTHFYITPLTNSSTTPAFFAKSLDVTEGATFQLQGGYARIDQDVMIAPGSNLFGHGLVLVNDQSNHIAFSNNGVIRPSGGELTIEVSGDARIDLDGDENGSIHVTNSNSNLRIHGKTLPTHGLIEISNGNTLSLSEDLITHGEIRMRGVGSPSTLDGYEITIRQGGKIVTNGGSNIIDARRLYFVSDSSLLVPAGNTLTFDVPKTTFWATSHWQVDGTLNVHGLGWYSGGEMTGTGLVRQNDSAFFVNDSVINMPNGTYDMDGEFESAIVRTYEGRNVTINAGALDTDGSNTFDGTLYIGGNLTVNTPQPWRVNGDLFLEHPSNPDASLNGTSMFIGSNAQVELAKGTFSLNAPFEVEPGAQIYVGGEDTAMHLNGSSTWHGGEVTGPSDLFLNGDALITGDALIAPGTFHWSDGGGNTTVLPGAALSVQADRLGGAGNGSFSGSLAVQGDVHVSLGETTYWNCDGTIHLTGGRITGDMVRLLDSGRIFVHSNFEPGMIDAYVQLSPGSQVNAHSGGNMHFNGLTQLHSGSLNTSVLTGFGSVAINSVMRVSNHSLIDVAQFDWDGVEDNSLTRIDYGRQLKIASPRINVTDNVFRGEIRLNPFSTLTMDLSEPWELAGHLFYDELVPHLPSHLGGRDVLVTGRIDANMTLSVNVTNAGVLSPGGPDYPGRLVFQARSWSQLPEGTVEFGIGGYAAGSEHDQITGIETSGTSTAHLGGTLKVWLTEDFEPQVGDVFTLIAAHTITGQFDNTILPPGFQVFYEQYPGLAPDYVKVCYTGPCPADLAPNDGDGWVDVSDLLALLASWGPCENCPADLAPRGGDGQVDVSDLLALFAAWGQCGPFFNTDSAEFNAEK